MSLTSVRRPMNWLCVAAFAAAFWITLRVMAAVPPPRAGVDPTAMQDGTSSGEVPDPALERMIARMARASTASRR